jgi:peptidoglycan/xylan/chitin deacetylase (PgdA/CDA1 family)
LVDAGFPVVHLATPFGGYNGQVLSRAQAEWYGNYPYLSITNTDNDVNSQGVYPYNTYVQAIKSTTTLANVQGWLANARDKKAWLILLIHEVDNPYNDPYNVDFATFQNMVDVVRQSGLPVVTYDEGFNRITAKQ